MNHRTYLLGILDDQPLDLSVPSRIVDGRNINGMVRRISGQNGSTCGQDDGHQGQEGSLGSSTVASKRRESALDNYQNKAYWANYHLHQALHKAKVYSQIRRDSKRRNSALGIESVRYSKLQIFLYLSREQCIAVIKAHLGWNRKHQTSSWI